MPREKDWQKINGGSVKHETILNDQLYKQLELQKEKGCKKYFKK